MTYEHNIIPRKIKTEVESETIVVSVPNKPDITIRKIETEYEEEEFEEAPEILVVNGEDGTDGYTPIKGVDYFDGKDGKKGDKGKDGKTPTKTELKAFIKEMFPEDKLLEKLIKKLPKAEVDSIEIGEDNNGQWIAKNGKKMYIKKQFSVGAGMSTGVYDFIALRDAPDSYVGQAGKVVKVKSDETGLEFGIGGGGGTPAGSTGEIQFNDGGAFGADSNIVWDNTNKRVGVQVPTPKASHHVAAAVGSTIADVVTGSVSLVVETLPTTPTGSITAIAMPAAPSSINLTLIDQSSGGFYFNDGDTITVRQHQVLSAGGIYYESQNYSDVSLTVSTGSDSYNLSPSFFGGGIPGETTLYSYYYDINSGGFNQLGLDAGQSTTFSGASGFSVISWSTFYVNSGGGTPPDAPVSFDSMYEDYGWSGFYESGTYYQYEVDTYNDIGGTNYVSGSPISIANYDANMGSYFSWQLSWTLTGSYDGVVLRRSTDGGSSWSYINIGSTSSYNDDNFSDDGSGSMWGNTYGGGGGSTTFSFYPYATGLSAANANVYSTQGTLYGVTLSDSDYYIFKHTFSSATGKVLNDGLSYGQLFSGSTLYDVGYTSWSSGTTVTPTSYGFSGTNQNRDYKAYGYSPTLGIYSQVPLTLSTTSSGGTKYVSGSVTYPSGISQIKILRQVNGGGYTVSKTLTSPTTTFIDDATDTTWNGNTTVSPNTILGTAGRYDRNSTTATDQPQIAVVATGSGTRYPKISFGVADDSDSDPTLQSHIYSNSTNGHLTAVTNQFQVAATAGGNATVLLGNTNIFNNTNSSSIHFQVKGQLDSSLINTRSDQDTVGFGQAIASDQFCTVQIHPNRSSDAGLVFIGHSGMTTSSNIWRVQTSSGTFNAEMTVGGWLRASAGAVGTPSLSCRTDTNTGAYFPSGDVFGLVSGGVEQCRADTGGLKIRGGSATSTYARVSGTLTTNTTAVGNVGTGEDNLISYTCPASLLSTNGDRVKFTATGTFAANANNKRIRAYFGTQVLLDTAATAFNTGDWIIEGEIIRTGATTQKAWCKFTCNNTLKSIVVDYTTPAMTLVSAQVIKLTGEATSNNDILEEFLTVDYCPTN